ncbi:MAG TPA: hypothetical protein VGM05_19690 [Planctomycetaceae bacterium]
MSSATPTSPNPAYTYGGVNNAAFLTQSDSYVPDNWSTNTAMPSPARQRQAGLAVSSKCYQFGGWNSSNVAQSQNDEMTPGSPSTWATRTAMTQARANAGTTYIGAKGYNFGGDNTTPTQTNTNFEYDPVGDSWATKAAYPTTSVDALVAFTFNSTAYAALGFPSGAVLKSYVVDAWTSKVSPSTTVTSFAAGASIDASNVGWVTGGTVSSIASSDQHIEYVVDTWTNRAAIPTRIQNGAASPA